MRGQHTPVQVGPLGPHGMHHTLQGGLQYTPWPGMHPRLLAGQCYFLRRATRPPLQAWPAISFATCATPASCPVPPAASQPALPPAARPAPPLCRLAPAIVLVYALTPRHKITADLAESRPTCIGSRLSMATFTCSVQPSIYSFVYISAQLHPGIHVCSLTASYST